MFVSKRLLILPLGLLITLVGCSGSRLQQIFAPDRDFMSLSELDEYEGLQRGPTSASVVLRDAGEKSEGGRLSSVAGWLRPKSKNNDALPSDPFLKDNNDTEADRKQPIVTVELSKNLGEDAEQLSSKNNTGFPSATTPEETVKRSSEAPTFADIMSEFEESADNLSTEPDIIDAMEEAWIENLSTESDSSDAMEEEAWLEKQSAESQTVSNWDTLLPEAIDDGSPKSESSDDGLILNFDMLNDEPSEEDDQVPTLNLAETVQESEKIDELIQELAASEAFDSFEDSSLELSDTADFFDSETADDESLWQSFDSTIERKSPDSDDSADVHKLPPLSDPFTVGNRDFDPVNEGANSSLQLPPIVQSSSAASSPGEQPAIAQSFTNGNPQPLTIAHNQSQTLSDDPFLNDFATQAAAPARAADFNIRAGSSIGTIQNVSTRTWLMLLGVVVIAYLLFAPEKKKQSHQNNR